VNLLVKTGVQVMVGLDGHNDHVSRGLSGIAVDSLTPSEWPQLQRVRLDALRDSPTAFVSSYELEAGWSEREWTATFERALWVVARTSRGIVGLARSTEADARSWQRHVEAVWVEPGLRSHGISRRLIAGVVEHERRMGVSELLLWVIEGNHQARRIYEHLGFRSTGERHQLSDRSGRFEERLRLQIG
jgi:GNAT superfamily N-acetyltransferase